MDEIYFMYKGKKSSDMGLKVLNDLVLTTPESDIQLIEVAGRDGDLAISNNRLKGINKSFPCVLNVPLGSTVDKVATKVAEWLRTDVSWDRLTFSGYEGYEFEALCYETFDIEETLRRQGRTVINFRLKPYKFKTGSKDSIVLSNGQILKNTEKRNAKPIIKITGTGNITLKNNGADWVILRSVDEYVTIDTSTMSIHKDGLQQFDKMNANLKPLFPVLKPGDNKITWTGTVTKIEIIPRWEAVV